MAGESARRKGWLFVFEGIDGSGKTTQKKRVAEALRNRGRCVVELFEPTDGPFGRRIRESSRSDHDRLLVEEEMELFIRDRMENVENNIGPALERGDVVLLDRYYFSTMAYQGARGVDAESIRRRNEAFAPRPDRVLYFSVSVDTALERIRRTRGGVTDAFERRDYLERVKAMFDAFAERFDFFTVIDAETAEKAVFSKTLQAVEKHLNSPRTLPELPN